jgi:methyl-accepting chemotaxis protein
MLKKLSLKGRLIVSFSLVALLTLVVAVAGYRGVVFGTEAQRKVARWILPTIQAQESLVKVLYYAQKTERTLANPHIDDGERQGQQEGLKRYHAEAEEDLKAYEDATRAQADPEDVRKMEEIVSLWKAWRPQHDKVVQLGLAGGADGGKAAFEASWGPARAALKEVETKLMDSIAEHRKEAEENNLAFERRASVVKYTSVVLGLAAVAASLLLGILISGSMARSLDRVAGNLDEGAHQVESASGQLTTSSQVLAEGSSEQAASLEEAASAMEEMSAMTRRNADSAAESKSLSDQANRSVEKASDSMGGLVRQMNEISSMSEEIGKIIKTIDEIAFQTNLLALNAAVEAARAGEAGAGFAVVADEVRNLAQRAAGAAKSTADLIEGALHKIQEGTGMVERTSVDFRDVVAAVKKVNELASEVAAASAEQNRGIGEVSAAVAQMDKVTQNNAASAEEIASASEQMNAQTLTLRQVVRELRALVAGADRLERAAAPAPRAPRAGKVRVAPPSRVAAPRGGAVAAPHAVRPSGAAQGGKASLAPPAAPRSRPRPEEAIPFDEDMSSF